MASAAAAAAATNWHSGVRRGEETLYVTWKGEQFGFTDLFKSSIFTRSEDSSAALKHGVDTKLWISSVNFCKFSISIPSVAEHWSKLNCAHSNYSELAHAHLSSSLAAVAAVGRSCDTLLLLFCCLFPLHVHLVASGNLKSQLIKLSSLAAPPLCYLLLLLLLSRWFSFMSFLISPALGQIQSEDKICKSRVSRT